ncbi:MAG: DUF177 domain-containing protein [Anaerolineae bacterium]|nr:DUF177 domain-containing protein [Anaerolineae bacterium]
MHLYVGKLLDRPVGAQFDAKFDLGFQDLSDDLSVESVKGKLTFLRTDDDIVGYGMLAVDIEAECTRCSVQVRNTVEIELEECFRPVTEISPGEQVSPIDASGYINLRPILRDLVIVSTPMQILCTPDCKGLCPRCGINLNQGQCDCELDDIDPRLAVLKLVDFGEKRIE